MAPVIGLGRLPKRSRDTESVKRFQQGGKRGKFRESPGKRGKHGRFVTGPAELFELRPGVFE